MSNSHVIHGKDEFAPVAYPYTHGPVSDQSTEAICTPLLKGRPDDRNISSFTIKSGGELPPQFVAIIQSAVPCNYVAPSRPIGLVLQSRLGSGVKSPVHHSDRTVRIRIATIGPQLLNGRAQLSK